MHSAAGFGSRPWLADSSHFATRLIKLEAPCDGHSQCPKSAVRANQIAWRCRSWHSSPSLWKILRQLRRILESVTEVVECRDSALLDQLTRSVLVNCFTNLLRVSMARCKTLHSDGERWPFRERLADSRACVAAVELSGDRALQSPATDASQNSVSTLLAYASTHIYDSSQSIASANCHRLLQGNYSGPVNREIGPVTLGKRSTRSPSWPPRRLALSRRPRS